MNVIGGQDKRHDQPLKEALFRFEGFLPYINWFYWNLVISLLHINLAKELGTLELIKKIINPRDHALVLESDFIQGSIINTEFPRSILLLHQHNWAPTRRGAWSNVSLADELMNLTLYLLILQKGVSIYWTIVQGNTRYQINGMFDLIVLRHPYMWSKEVFVFFY